MTEQIITKPGLVSHIEESKPGSLMLPVLPVLLVAGMGFMVDVYDIVIFAVERVPSLTSLGVKASQSLSAGVLLLNMQLIGMILGGFLWGILGDKKGRRSVLFGSILLYSLSTLLNAFVTDIPVYALLRFLAGVGLAGEVGAAMVIAAEVTPKKYRALGTAFVGALGCSGAVLASIVADILPWRTAYLLGGLIGLILLLARMSIKETELFERILSDNVVKRGSVRLLLMNKDRLLRLIRCVLAAVPLWFAFGVMVSFAPEILHSTTNTTATTVSIAAIVMSFCIGDTVGEMGCGIFSKLLGKRKLPILIFAVIAMIIAAVALNSPAEIYGLLCLPLGFFLGSWSMVVTTAAEQFGTNLRATATTLVPNLVRASAIPITLGFCTLAPVLGPVNSAMCIGAVCFAGAIVSILLMEETAQKDLDFIET